MSKFDDLIFERWDEEGVLERGCKLIKGFDQDDPVKALVRLLVVFGQLTHALVNVPVVLLRLLRPLRKEWTINLWGIKHTGDGANLIVKALIPILIVGVFLC